MHMDTIGRINQDALSCYFAVRKEHDASRLALGEEYTPYVDAKINANVVKAGSHEVVLYDHFQGLFHVKANRGRKKTSSSRRTYRVNLLMEHRDGRFDSDPLDRSILVLQDRHRSQLVDSGQVSGVVPPLSQIKGLAISAQWLREQFSYPPTRVDEVILQHYARAFILTLLGGAFSTSRLAHMYNFGLHVGRLDFRHPPMPIVVPHAHDEVVDGLHDHLLSDEALPIDPLGHRWRVSLSLSHNPSPHVLTFYQDQLDAQTQDQVKYGHRVHLTHEPSTSLGPSMRPPSLITPIRTYSPPSPPSSQPSISLDAPPPVIKEQLMPHDYMYGYLEDIELYMYVEFYLHQFHLTRQVM
ncbi:hypothetical protein AAG906_021482 [Vitis piasezkii]